MSQIPHRAVTEAVAVLAGHLPLATADAATTGGSALLDAGGAA